MSSVLIKSFVLDMINVHDGGGLGGARRFEFFLNGSRHDFPGAAGISVFIDNSKRYIGSYGSPESLFKTDLPVVDSVVYGWRTASDAFDGSAFRLIAVFDTSIEVDEIVYNAIHDWGTSAWLGYGLKDIIITYSEEDLSTNPTFGIDYVSVPIAPPGSLPGAVEIFNGEVRQHVQSNVRDDQIISVSPPTNVELDVTIVLAGGFTVKTPTPGSVEVDAVVDIIGGFSIDVALPVEMQAAVNLFGGFAVGTDKIVELDAVLSLVGGFDIATTKLSTVEMGAALSIAGGFGVDVNSICELKAILTLNGGFIVDVPPDELCFLPKFTEKRWC